MVELAAELAHGDKPPSKPEIVSAHTDVVLNFTPHQLSILIYVPLAITLIVSFHCARITMGAHKYVEELAKRKQSVSD